MKLLFLGDTHAEWNDLWVWTHHPRPQWDAVIQVGDFGWWPKEKEYALPEDIEFPMPVYFIPGNHEDWWDLKNYETVTELRKNLFYVPKNTTLELGGRTIYCMGGAESVDKAHRELGRDWFPEESISQRDILEMTPGFSDIVVSHDAPEFFNLDRILFYSKVYPEFRMSRLALNEVMDEKRPKRWFFGHHHKAGVFGEVPVEKTEWFLCPEASQKQAWMLDTDTMEVKRVMVATGKQTNFYTKAQGYRTGAERKAIRHAEQLKPRKGPMDMLAEVERELEDDK